MQDIVPWLTALPLVPKLIVSVLIVGAALLLLVLIWTAPPDDAIKTILLGCYRRALFTRMHAQLNQ